MHSNTTNTTTAAKTRTRKTADEKLQDLLAAQSSLAAQLAAQKRKIATRDALAHKLHLAALGEAVFAAWGNISLDDARARLAGVPQPQPRPVDVVLA